MSYGLNAYSLTFSDGPPQPPPLIMVPATAGFYTPYNVNEAAKNGTGDAFAPENISFTNTVVELKDGSVFEVVGLSANNENPEPTLWVLCKRTSKGDGEEEEAAPP